MACAELPSGDEVTWGGMGELCLRARERSPSIWLAVSSGNGCRRPPRSTSSGGCCFHPLLGGATTSTTWDHGVLRQPRRTPWSLITIGGRTHTVAATATHTAARSEVDLPVNDPGLGGVS